MTERGRRKIEKKGRSRRKEQEEGGRGEGKYLLNASPNHFFVPVCKHVLKNTNRHNLHAPHAHTNVLLSS